MASATPNSGPDSRTSEWAIIVIGALLSLAGAILVPIIAKKSESKLDIVLGVLVFLGGYIVTVDLAARKRSHDEEHALMRRLDRSDGARLGALPLQRLLDVPEIERPVSDIVEAAAKAQHHGSRFVSELTIERIDQYARDIRRASDGRFVCSTPEDELALLRRALAATHETVFAIAALGLDHWRSPHFSNYFRAYHTYGKRLQITRVFLVSRNDLQDGDMRKILEAHHAHGVNAYALDKDFLPDDGRRSVVLFDKSLVLVHSRGDADTTKQVEFIDDNDVNALRRQREYIADIQGRLDDPTHEGVLWIPEMAITQAADPPYGSD